MNEVIDKIFHIEDGNYQIYEGNYEAFLKQKVSLRTETKKVKQKKEIRVKDKKNSTKKVELEIEKLEQLKKELENQTLDPQVYNDWEKLKSINFELTKISTDLDQLYEVLFQ
jgi:ATPase subunit of ABC transporter with duplicated ATPase domains